MRSFGRVRRVAVVEVGERGFAVFEVDDLQVRMALVEPTLDELGVVEVVLDQKHTERSTLAAFAFCHGAFLTTPAARRKAL